MNYNVKYTGNKLSSSQKLFIEKWHYTKSARSQMTIHVFELTCPQGLLLGVALFGKPCGKNVSEAYGGAIELRRFVLIDNTMKNAESFFLSKCLRWLEINTDIPCVISYADPNKGHKGMIYRATNFEYLGKQQNNNSRCVIYKGKIIHMRQVYQKDKNGDYYKSSLAYQKAVKTGSARIKKLKPKHVFMYKLRNRS